MALAGTRVVRAVAAEIGNEELAMLDRDGNPGTVFDALLRRAGLGWLPAYATRQVAADGHPHPDPGIGRPGRRASSPSASGSTTSCGS